jgi:hypothetical protein
LEDDEERVRGEVGFGDGDSTVGTETERQRQQCSDSLSP